MLVYQKPPGLSKTTSAFYDPHTQSASPSFVALTQESGFVPEVSYCIPLNSVTPIQVTGTPKPRALWLLCLKADLNILELLGSPSTRR